MMDNSSWVANAAWWLHMLTISLALVIAWVDTTGKKQRVSYCMARCHKKETARSFLRISLRVGALLLYAIFTILYLAHLDYNALGFYVWTYINTVFLVEILFTLKDTTHE